MITSARRALSSLFLAGLVAAQAGASASAGDGWRIVSGSIRTLEADGQSIGTARVVRAQLTADELAAPLSFSVSLRMRDFAGLQARVAAGDHIAWPEMEARYFPLRGDYDRVAAWLAAQGFTQTMPDRSHTSVFVRGPVADVARSFGIRFARVAVSDGEYSSAISEPAMPADLASLVIGVNGLQPQFRLRHFKPAPLPVPSDLVGQYPYVTPDNVVSAYDIPKSATGAGQIIAIVGEAPAVASDLTKFWTTTGVAQVVGNVTTISVNGGGGANPSVSATTEANLDVEWAGAIAPGAGIRLYVSQDTLAEFTQIQNDIPTYPAMTVLSISYGNTEGLDGAAQLQYSAQIAASMTAMGMSILAASGDAGSNPNGSIAAKNYSASAPLGVSYPASDLSVTGVGGSSVNYGGTWSYEGENAWDQLSTGSGSGGGVSAYFQKPAWQTGGGVLAGRTMRCVPDVAAFADSNLTDVNLGAKFQPYTASDVGALVYVNGADQGIGGTSLACPVWSGVVALINQGRASAGLGPIGFLNPHLYPLVGTSAFNDVTTGTNGAYSAGPGYDLCTGLGSPNVANLMAALGGRAPSVHRLVNVSARAQVGTGANIVIAGFVVQGPPGTTKDILVRGVGPALVPLGVAGAIINPVVGVYDNGAVLIASNVGWGHAPLAGSSTVAATFRSATAADMKAVGAFALPAGSADSAMVLTLPIGNYTVQVSGVASTTGVALSEVYELDTAAPEILENISARCFVGTGSQVAISGFVVAGNQPAQLLIRGVGPALAGFGLSGVLAQPSIGLFDSTNTLIASDTGWGNALTSGTSPVTATYRQATAADMTAVGAFGLTAGSADSAIVVTLPPGSYTAVVSGMGSTTGTALAEVYEMSGP